MIILISALTVTARADNRAPVTDAGNNTAIEQRLLRLERMLNSQGLLDLLQQVDALQTEIGRLRGEVEVQNHEIAQLKEQQRNLFTDIDRRMQRMESPATGATAGPVQPLDAIEPGPGVTVQETATELTMETEIAAGPEETVAPENTSPEIPDTETTVAVVSEEPAVQAGQAKVDPLRAQADYQQAFKLLKQANYDQAIKAFSEYLEKYPVSEYSDNAQYWLGETFYVTRKFDNAISAYQNLIENYPESRKVAHGMLKLGYSYQELGNLPEAKKRLEELKNRYPGSTAARLADERLRTIKIPGSS
ncbi:MAG: tol-pal system protein YbgF [Thiotrichales bacterium]|nr:tol-pal system protein YbgF [Thiotrichales bacterium]